VLSPEQIDKLINAATNLKHRLILMTIYSAGLRIRETAELKPEHIDSKEMLIKVERGKGGHQRYTCLSSKLLKELRRYYKICRPRPYLFPSSYKDRLGQPLTNQAIREIYHKACKKAGIKNAAGPHTLRHSGVYTPLAYYASAGSRIRYPPYPGLIRSSAVDHHDDLSTRQP
jgi:integrase